MHGLTESSQIREIPDHQEVYLDRDGFTSITIDILERVDHPATDEEALTYHLLDITDETDQLCIASTNPAELSKHLVPAYSLIASTSPTPNTDGGSDLTIIMLLLMRLEMQNTDVLVAVNIPYRGKQFTSGVVDLSPNLASGMVDDNFELGWDILKAIEQSFEIQDWGLFGE